MSLIKDKAMRGRLRRLLGKRGKRLTRVTLTFDLLTPLRHGDPAQDEVLLLDIVDDLSERIIGFHEIGGFCLRQYRAGGKSVI